MIKTLVSVALWALAGLLLGAWMGAATGWAVFALGLCIMVLVSGMHLERVARWVRNLDDPPPPAVGPWDDILAPVYRRLRRSRAELKRLRQRVNDMMLAAEALPDGATMLDAHMTLIWCNQMACEHLGLNLQTDLNHSIFNVFRVPEFARYARQGSWPAPILLHLHQHGRRRALLVQMTRYGQGEHLIVTRDVTQIEKLETMRKDFVANASHELRTPLTVLAGFLDTLLDHGEDAITPDQRRHYLNLMRDQSVRMQATVGDLLTLSALESAPHANGRPVALAGLIEEALVQARALSGGCHEFTQVLDAALTITGEPAELRSAITNLITNAVHYTPEGGRIDVSWQAEKGGGARFQVSDTGIGIAARDIPRLTERFYRVDRGRSRATGGTGLGLAITRHVALRHDAELHIESRLGAGSRFSLHFPPGRLSETPDDDA
ncbi:MAG: phosphate regulon sensor histidine kinase PhoR [Castellaniella sp.]